MKIAAITTLMLSVLLLTAAAEETGVETKTFEKLVQPVLQKYCIDCHGADVQEARLRYDKIEGFRLSDRHLWTMIHEQISQGAMPPKDDSQLSAMEKQQLLAWIEKEQRGLEAGSTRRLNRREFGSALQDISGLKVDFAYSLPGDGKVDGFDTGAEALQDASDSVSQMMEVTSRVVQSIRFLEPPPSKVLQVDLVNVQKDPRQAFQPWQDAGITLENLPKIAMPGMGALVEPRWPRDRSDNLFRVPALPENRGVVRVKFSVASYAAFPKMPNPILWIEIGGRVFDRREITGPMDLEYQVLVDDLRSSSKGVSVSFTPRVELPYAVEGFENEDKSKPGQLPNGAGLFRPVWDRRVLKDPQQQPQPFVVLKSVEVEPHFVAAWPPSQWKVDLGELTDSDDSAQKLLALWMDRAYRRPVTSAEQKPFFTFYK